MHSLTLSLFSFILVSLFLSLYLCLSLSFLLILPSAPSLSILVSLRPCKIPREKCPGFPVKKVMLTTSWYYSSSNTTFDQILTQCKIIKIQNYIWWFRKIRNHISFYIWQYPPRIFKRFWLNVVALLTAPTPRRFLSPYIISFLILLLLYFFLLLPTSPLPSSPLSYIWHGSKFLIIRFLFFPNLTSLFT